MTGRPSQRGSLPLWNPYAGIGKPFLGEPSTAVFYPGYLLFHILGSIWAMRLSWLAHLVLAGARLAARRPEMISSDA